jgi:hypothetical protein
MRFLQALLVVACLCVPAAASAQRSPVLVELFTSQGCSSCPPADAILAEIAGRPGVVALALHVDYWDYLGWRDSFGQAAHSRRQRAYAKAAGSRSIYTPQMIVQGVDRVVGADYDEVTRLIAAHQARPPAAALEAVRDGRRLRIRVTPASPAGAGASEVYVVRFLPRERVAIAHGENAGHEIDYTNIVTDWTPVARWDGRSDAELALDIAGPDPVAVIVQRERLGPVVTAARLP